MDTPRTIGEYRVERRLRRGDAGTVYLARAPAGEARDLTVRPGLTGVVGEDGAPRIPVLGSTNGFHHPRVLRIGRFGFAAGAPFTVSPHRRGQTLAERIEAARAARRYTGLSDRPQSANEALAALVATFENLARALHGAHEAGFIHGHIDPTTLLVTGDHAPLLLDLGLPVLPPKALSRLDPAALAFTAPERLRGHGLDPRSDVFSLGACLYEAIARRRPFRGDSPGRLATAMERGPSSFRPDHGAASADLERVVRAALAPDPAGRYRSALAFADDLARIRRHAEVAIQAPSFASRAQSWRRRNPGGAGRVAGLAATAACIVLIAFFLRHRAVGHAEAAGARLRDAERARNVIAHLADGDRLKTLRDERAAAVSTDQHAHTDWTRRARSLVARIPAHRAALAEVERTASGFTERTPTWEDLSACALADWRRDALAAAGIPGSDRWVERRDAEARRLRRRRLATRRLVFPTLASTWRHRALADLVDDLERFAETVADVAPANFARDWSACARAIAAAPRYAGLRVTPDPELVPLGPDPRTGLHEFAHRRTGAAPRRDAATGALVIDDASAVVLVLVPGGTFRMGAHPRDRRPDARERPPHDVTLDPFFIAKHEVTEGQFLRAVGRCPGTLGDTPTDALHPVTSLDHTEAQRAARQLGFDLPTEAQWEYAARTGAAARPGGASRRSLRDLRAHVGSRDTGPDLDAFARDGAPRRIGGGRPNDFGLHDLLGNVAEWCADSYAPYTVTPAPRTGERRDATTDRVVRGGDWAHGPAFARPTARRRAAATMASPSIGFRIARPATGATP